MIYDCFSFYNELDILRLRLNILNDFVDRFVIVEARFSHTGQPKALNFEANKHLFEDFLDKIDYIVVEDEPSASLQLTDVERHWANENIQRNAIMRGLVNAKDNDLIIISDLDEIPNPNVFSQSLKDGDVVALRQYFFYYRLNMLNYVTPYWERSKMLTFGTLKNENTYVGMKSNDALIESVNDGPTATRIRFLRPTKVIKNGGWHFSYMGSANHILLKKKSIVDGEAVTRGKYSTSKDIEEIISKGLDVNDSGNRFFALPLSDVRLPDYIRSHQEEWRQYIFPVDNAYLIRTQYARISSRVKGVARKFCGKLVPPVFKPVLFNVYLKFSKNPIY